MAEERNRRITLRDIAEKTGYSVATVSRALRANSRLRSSTVEDVRRAADELGYRPDPALAALATYRRDRTALRDYGNLAFLVPARRDEHYYTGSGPVAILSSARQRATELGYSLEVFYTGDYRDASQLSQTLLARGIRGVIHAPCLYLEAPLGLQIDRFCLVNTGINPAAPACHTVAADHFHDYALCYRKLHEAGRRRIGLCASSDQLARSAGRAEGAFLYEQYRRLAAGERDHEVPILRTEEEGALREWLERYRIDGVIALYSTWQKLRAMGAAIPDEVGFASPSVGEGSIYSGALNGSPTIGLTAANLLDRALRRGEVGLPENPLHVLVRGRWYDAGTTVEGGATHLKSFQEPTGP